MSDSGNWSPHDRQATTAAPTPVSLGIENQNKTQDFTKELGFEVHALPEWCRIVDRTFTHGTPDRTGVVNVSERIGIEEQDVRALTGFERPGFLFDAKGPGGHNGGGLRASRGVKPAST